MKLLLLSWNHPATKGGIERLVADLYERLAADGHAVTLVTGRTGEYDGEHGATACPLPGVLPFLGFAAARGLQLARNARPDVIVCSSIVASPAAALLGVVLRVPYVVLVHGTEVRYARRRHGRAFDALAGGAAALIANSHATAKELPAKVARRTVVVHPGIRSARFELAACAETAAGVTAGGARPVLLTVGRLVRRKGVLEFVRRVLPGLVAEFPDLLYLVAGDDPTRSLFHRERPAAAIRAAVAELGLEGSVRLLGAVDEAELALLYRRADLFVLPCLEMADDVEGFGLAVLEAAAAGLPAVATAVGGLAETVRDRVTGLLVPPGNDAALGEAIRTLLLDASRRRALGEQAAVRVRREFDWSVALARYTAVLDRCSA